MLKNIKAVLFDLDGTLTDSMWIWEQIDIDYFAAKNITMPDDLQRQLEGLSMRETATYIKGTCGVTDDEEEMMATWNQMAMDTYKNHVPFKKGAKEFLQHLKDQGIKTGIATSNSKELLQAVSNSLGLDKYIDCFMTANEVAHGKPSPDIYLEVAKQLEVLPEECLVFEDVIPGIMAGKNAGMKVCAVYDAYSEKDTKDKMELADYFVNDFEEIIV